MSKFILTEHSVFNVTTDHIDAFVLVLGYIYIYIYTHTHTQTHTDRQTDRERQMRYVDFYIRNLPNVNIGYTTDREIE